MSSDSYNSRENRSQEAPTVRITVRKNGSKSASSASKSAQHSAPKRRELLSDENEAEKVIGMRSDRARKGENEFVGHHAGSTSDNRPRVTKNGAPVKAEPAVDIEDELDLDLDLGDDFGSEFDMPSFDDDIRDDVFMSESEPEDDGFDEDYYDYLDDEEPEKPDRYTRKPIIVSGRDEKPVRRSVSGVSAGEQVRELRQNIRRAGKNGAVSVSRSVEAAGAEMLRAPRNARATADAVRSGVRTYREEAPAAIKSYCGNIPELTSNFFERHNIVRWAKNRTASQWVKTAAAALAILLVVGIGGAFLYFDSMLDKINYTSADKFSQLSEEEADKLAEELNGNSDEEDDREHNVVSETDEEEPEAPAVVTETDAPKKEVVTKKLSEFTDSMYDVKKNDVVNILLLGTDTRENAYVRDNSDTMILCSINKKDKNIKLTSFMRDSYVSIPGYSSQKRLNSAFASGGASLLFKTLKKNFDVEVDKYVRVNFVAFKKIVDAVGGIDMKLTDKEANYMCHHKVYGKFPRFEAGGGVYRLNGAEALNYARCRKVDSDFGRTERQRKVIAAAADKMKHSSIPVLTALLNELLPLVETNLTKEEIYSLIPTGLASISKDIEMLNIPVKGSWSDYKTEKGQWVIKVNTSKNKKAYKAHVFSSTRLDLASVTEIAHYNG